MRKYIIDGYNLVYQFPELRRILERDLEGARQGLLDRIGLYIGENRLKAVVVFDGDGRVLSEPGRRLGIEVIYSKPPEKADPLIKRMIENHSDEGLVVVSSDREIVDFARLCGVKAVSSSQFVHEMSDRPKNEAEKKFDYPMSDDELDEWMHLFRKNETGDEES